MDRHRLHHHHHSHFDPRYTPLRPQHQHQPSLFHPPPLPPPTHGRFPPPPQQPRPPPLTIQQPPVRPASPCFLHNPPLSRRQEGNFVDSSHQQQSCRYEGDFTNSSHRHHHPHPPRVVFDVDRRLPDPSMVGDLDMKIDMDYDRRRPGPIHRPVNFDRTVKIDDVDDGRFRTSSRFREELRFENPNSTRFYPVDEFRGRRDDRRVVEIDNQHYHREQYHPGVLLSEFELNSGSNKCVVRGPVVDEVPIRVSRDEDNVRHGVQPRSRDVSHSPVKFRNRGIDIDDGLYEKGMNIPGSEFGKFVDVDSHSSGSGSSSCSLRKDSQKKSAFLRIQFLKHTTSPSSRSSRFSTSPSPHKGKGKDKDKDKDKESSEYLDHKSSQGRGLSPVELDVSFKSNALVAKAIVGNPSTSPTDCNVNSSVSDLDGARIGDSESPLRKEIVKKCENTPSLSREEVKDLEKKVVRPVMKRVGPSNNADSLKGSVDKGSLGVEVQNSDRKGDKLPASNVRKRKKSIIRPARLSRSVLAKTDVESLNKDASQNQPSSSVSDKCIKKSDIVSLDDQFVQSTNKETMEQPAKFDLNESPNGLEGGVMDHSDYEASCPMKLRKRKGSSEPKAANGSENSNGTREKVKMTSDSDEDVSKVIEKCSSDIDTECNGGNDQNLVPLSVDCGSGEGSPEPVACSEGNLDSVDVNSREVNMHNSVVVANATSSSLDVSNRAQERIEETCIPDKLCETKVVLSSEINAVEIPFDGLHLDEGNGQSEPSSSVKLTNSAKVSKIDVHSHEPNTTVNNVGLVSVDSEILTPFSDINPTNDTEEHECQGTGTTSAVGESMEGAAMTIDLSGCSFPSFSLEKDVFLPNRKRKVIRKLDSLDSGAPASLCERAVSVPVKDSDSVEKTRSAISGSPCVIAESNVLHSNELTENPLATIPSMNHGCDSDPIEGYCSCSKKQKILSLESVSSDALPFEKCDIPAPENTLASMIEVPVNCVKNSSSPAVMVGLPNYVHTNKNVTGEGTDNLLTCNFVDNSKADFLLESSLPMEEIAHLDGKQSSFSSESGKQQDNLNINVSECSDRSRSVAVESEDRMATDHPNGSASYLRPEISRDSDNETPVMGMECENNIISNDVSPSLSDSPQLCAESAYDGLTKNSNILETPGNVSSSEAECLGAPTVDTSDIVSAVNALSEMKESTDDKGSSSLPSSISDPLVDCNKINLKPGVSSSKSDLPFVPKTVKGPSKNANILISSSNVLSRQHVGRTSYTGNASSVMTTSTKAPSAYPAKPRIWCRSDNTPASNMLVKKSSVNSAPSQRPPIDKTMKFRSNSYIRKGNSLVRNPGSTATTLGPNVFSLSYNQSKPNEKNKVAKRGSSGVIDSTVVHDIPSIGSQNTSIEMPKTPPLPCSDKASTSDALHSENCTFSAPVVSEGLDNAAGLRSLGLHFSRTPVVGNRHIEDAGALSDGNLPGPSEKRVVYVKRKSNQLIAAMNSPDPSVSKVDMPSTLSCDSSYYKRKKNQLIRASSESNIHQMVAVIDDSSSSQPQKASHSHVSRSSTKKRSNKVKPAKVSLVWKLGDRNSFDKGSDLLVRGKLLSHLLPWKRATYLRSVWRSSGNMPNCYSVKNKKLVPSRRRAIVYVRSGGGFSLRRSKVISVAGSSLKWSKSMERHSKKVEEEVANAVAAARKNMGASNVRAESTHHSSQKPGERIFRIGVYRYRMDPSRRSLHRIPDEESADSLDSKPAKDVRKTYVPKRLLIGSDEYVRIGNGNQLVRDPKRRTRILASEKIRWSLHTARTRLAKKRKFCQFFTRFGKCNKGEGKCHFIHDPSKIAVCTKFLNSLCGDPNCKLTHKVIPERMPDCSFFLQGMCSNENCPYRHVNVNPKASICESFLRGYCAEGNECRKKHSYSCPEYEATGSCPQGSRCKLYHPRKGKSQKRKASKDQRNSRRRYFGSGYTTTSQPQTMAEKLNNTPQNDCSDCKEVDLGDFISLDVSDDEVEEPHDGTCAAMDVLEGRGSKSELDDDDDDNDDDDDDDDDDDELITPFRLLVRP